MSKEARSRGACWTCRLRRKKCDEGSPVCSACSSISIPCYGYGPKPAWSDGGEMQKAKVKELRVIIREASSLRRRRGKHSRSEAVCDLAEGKSKCKGTFNGDHSLDHASTTDLGGLVENIAPAGGALSRKQQLSGPAPAVKINTCVISKSPIGSQNIPSDFLEYDSQSNLLMHYLDVVFPRQFPLYNPSASEGGRGWLLFIILRTRPLYHAALSFAAHHQQSLESQDHRSASGRYDAKGMLYEHHALAMKELRYHLEGFKEEEGARSFQGNIEVLACIVFLISLEVFTGDTQSWRLHLQAAQALLLGLAKGCSKLVNEPPSPSHTKAFFFFTAAIAWYDILSCASTGLKPWAPTVCLEGESAFIRVYPIIGCENSVLVSIREIAVLNEWKTTSQNTYLVNARELADRGSQIEQRLEAVLARHSGGEARYAETDIRSSGGISLIEPATQHAGSVITQVFACAALVYLNVVVYGPCIELPKIQGSVSRTIGAFQELRDRTIMGVFAWPLCIAGCMATSWQQDFFRHLSLDIEDVSDVKAGNLRRCYRIMEECWRMRREKSEGDEGPGWLQAMESLDMKILLI